MFKDNLIRSRIHEARNHKTRYLVSSATLKSNDLLSYIMSVNLSFSIFRIINAIFTEYDISN